MCSTGRQQKHCWPRNRDPLGTLGLTGNQLNYTNEGDVLSEGRESIVGHHVGYAGLPYPSGESAGASMQSFEAELTELFVRERIESQTKNLPRS